MQIKSSQYILKGISLKFFLHLLIILFLSILKYKWNKVFFSLKTLNWRCEGKTQWILTLLFRRNVISAREQHLYQIFNLLLSQKWFDNKNLWEETERKGTRQKPLGHNLSCLTSHSSIGSDGSHTVSADWKTDRTRDLINTERRSVLGVGAVLTDEIRPCLSSEPRQARRWSRRETVGPFCSAAVKKWEVRNKYGSDRQGGSKWAGETRN